MMPGLKYKLKNTNVHFIAQLSIEILPVRIHVLVLKTDLFLILNVSKAHYISAKFYLYQRMIEFEKTRTAIN